MNPHLARYLAFQKDRLLEIRDTHISALNAGALATKLLQIASGAVYNDDGEVTRIDEARYDLVTDLAAGREHSVVLYQWNHQRDELERRFKKADISCSVLDSGNASLQREYQ